MFSKSDDATAGLQILAGGTMPKVSGAPEASLLESFPNRYPGRNYIVSLVFPEFTSLCPVTGQPDFGVISVEYIPDQLCVESKSFKLYMFAYRNHESFMETISNKILEDICLAIAPAWCRVKGLFAPRGAIQLHVFAENFKDLSPERAKDIRQAVAFWQAESNPHRP